MVTLGIEQLVLRREDVLEDIVGLPRQDAGAELCSCPALGA